MTRVGQGLGIDLRSLLPQAALALGFECQPRVFGGGLGCHPSCSGGRNEPTDGGDNDSAGSDEGRGNCRAATVGHDLLARSGAGSLPATWQESVPQGLNRRSKPSLRRGTKVPPCCLKKSVPGPLQSGLGLLPWGSVFVKGLEVDLIQHLFVSQVRRLFT